VTDTIQIPPRLGRGLRRPGRGRARLSGYLFIAPAFVIFFVFTLYAAGYGLAISFSRWNGLSPDWSWVGIQNYLDLLGLGGKPSLNASMANATWNTLAGVIVLPIALVILGLILALLLNSIRRFRTFLRTVYFLPFVTAGIAVYYAWRFIYQPDGLINAVLGAVGLEAVAQGDGFLGNPSTALAAVLAVQIWSGVPVAMLLYLTGLQTMPDSVIEAAKIDGAGPVRTTVSIIFPLLNPITALVVILALQQALQNFQIYLLMTNGGPVGSTNTLGLQAYTFAFGGFAGSGDPGYASALGWLLALVAIAIAIANTYVLRRRT